MWNAGGSMLKTFMTACAAAIALCAATAGAQTILPQRQSDISAVALRAGWAEPDGRRIAGLQMDLAPGWKTYWRNPGDAGIPPQFDWTGSENLARVQIAWPTPVVFDTAGSRTIGYENRMLLPLALRAEDPSLPIRVRLSMFYGLCDDICVPARTSVALDIPPGSEPEAADLIRDALVSTPEPAQRGGLAEARCGVEGADARRTFSARFVFDAPPVSAPVVVVEGPEGVWFGPVDSHMEDGAIVASGEVETEPGRWIDRSSLLVTLLDGGRGLSLRGCEPIG